MPSAVPAVLPDGFPADHITFVSVCYGLRRIEFPAVEHIVLFRYLPGAVKAVRHTVSGLPPAGVIGKGQIPFIPHAEAVMAFVGNKSTGCIKRLVMLPVSYILRYINGGTAGPQTGALFLGCRNQHTEFPQLFIPDHMGISPVQVSVISGVGPEIKVRILFPMF